MSQYTADKKITEGLKKLQEDVSANYDKVEIERALDWISEEVVELKEAVKKNNGENIKEELTQLLVWCFSIANILEVNLYATVEKEINHHLTKYPKR